MIDSGKCCERSRGRIIVFSAPSGSGKSTIIKQLKEHGKIPFSFSVSATNREPRKGEIDGKDYYFLSDEEFKRSLTNEEFVEHCEVYPGRYYGTLKREISSKCSKGENVLLDVDVEGGRRIKQLYGEQVVSIFIEPPSLEVLGSRLRGRGTDSEEKINERLARAGYELKQAQHYDYVIVNDVLDRAVEECEKILEQALTGDKC